MKNYVNREMDLNTIMEMAKEYGIVIDTEWSITDLINAVNAAIKNENVNEVKGNEKGDDNMKNENVKEEAKELYEGLNYLISSLTKEDLKKLFTADTKDAFSLLNQMINDNFKALSQLLGSKVESAKMTEVYKKIESFKSKHISANIVMSLIGNIIKLIIGVIKLGVKALVTIILNIIELLILLVRGAFRTVKKIVNIIKIKPEEDYYDRA